MDAIALQKALYGALSADAELAALMDGVRIFDHAPANARFPYMTFGRTSVYDWSTDTDTGSEHLVTLHAWSKEKGRLHCLQILERAQAVLDDEALNLDGATLVNLQTAYCEARYEDDNDVYHGLLRFRAVTEKT